MRQLRFGYIANEASLILLDVISEKENLMKSLKLFSAAIRLAGMAGCLSFSSGGKAGPPGPQGESGAKETIIIMPDSEQN